MNSCAGSGVYWYSGSCEVEAMLLLFLNGGKQGEYQVGLGLGIKSNLDGTWMGISLSTKIRREKDEPASRYTERIWEIWKPS
jgi:hypothetical protein